MDFSAKLISMRDRLQHMLHSCLNYLKNDPIQVKNIWNVPVRSSIQPVREEEIYLNVVLKMFKVSSLVVEGGKRSTKVTVDLVSC